MSEFTVGKIDAQDRHLDNEWGVYDDMSCFVASFNSKETANAAAAHLKLNPKVADSPAKLRKLIGCVYA